VVESSANFLQFTRSHKHTGQCSPPRQHDAISDDKLAPHKSRSEPEEMYYFGWA
jgi:hypothetical protein